MTYDYNEAETRAELVEDDVFRFSLSLEEPSGEMSGKMSGKILAAMRDAPEITIPELAELIGVTERSIERNIRKLRDEKRLRRVGPDKGGHWEVLE